MVGSLSTDTISKGATNSVGSTVEKSHYDETYFKWQVGTGTLAGVLNGPMYRPYIKPEDKIFDFGCGGGFLLSSLTAKEKMGVEINPTARACAAHIGINTVASLDALPEESFDVAISCHALEHTEAPLDVVRTVKGKLKLGGLAVFVVPAERYDTEYTADNIDQHLYTWAPVNLGNLFKCAGFEILSVERIARRWPPGIVLIKRYLGVSVAQLSCAIFAWLAPKLTQIRVVAKRLV